MFVKMTGGVPKNDAGSAAARGIILQEQVSLKSTILNPQNMISNRWNKKSSAITLLDGIKTTLIDLIRIS
jgi:hypothetical protein